MECVRTRNHGLSLFIYYWEDVLELVYILLLPTQIEELLYRTLLLPHTNDYILSWGYKCDRITKIKKRAFMLIHLSK